MVVSIHIAFFRKRAGDLQAKNMEAKNLCQKKILLHSSYCTAAPSSHKHIQITPLGVLSAAMVSARYRSTAAKVIQWLCICNNIHGCLTSSPSETFGCPGKSVRTNPVLLGKPGSKADVAGRPPKVDWFSIITHKVLMEHEILDKPRHCVVGQIK